MLSPSAQYSVQKNWPDVLLQAVLGSTGCWQNAHRIGGLHFQAGNAMTDPRFLPEQRDPLTVGMAAGFQSSAVNGARAFVWYGARAPAVWGLNVLFSSNQVSVLGCDQPQDCQGARTHHAAIAARRTDEVIE
jgi:hypothetical protein